MALRATLKPQLILLVTYLCDLFLKEKLFGNNFLDWQFYQGQTRNERFKVSKALFQARLTDGNLEEANMARESSLAITPLCEVAEADDLT
ncbi:hypothetical protein CRG98_013423 [Punica granatum]|uniref:Uncharacterized protein n=1 Tax=Punica granatum TaxID=22663 RepID=A0A2I0KD66_PUNGR|nr:hypothetical protein CRG98_013423 [Punica granatum]